MWCQYFPIFLEIDIDIHLGEEKNGVIGGVYSFVKRVNHESWLRLGGSGSKAVLNMKLALQKCLTWIWRRRWRGCIREATLCSTPAKFRKELLIFLAFHKNENKMYQTYI